MRVPKVRDTCILGSALVAAGVISFAGVGSASAASATSLANVNIGGDLVHNYDYNSTTALSNNVDWAVTVFFTQNAEIDAVKAFYGSYLSWTGGNKYAYMRDDANYTWDDDRGIKNGFCSGSDKHTDHLRLYAPPGADRMYNMTYSFMVFGTTHIDFAECGSGTYFGASEWVEDKVTNWAGARGKATRNDNLYMNNNEPYRVEGDHRWDNNGAASQVRF